MGLPRVPHCEVMSLYKLEDKYDNGLSEEEGDTKLYSENDLYNRLAIEYDILDAQARQPSQNIEAKKNEEVNVIEETKNLLTHRIVSKGQTMLEKKHRY